MKGNIALKPGALSRARRERKLSQAQLAAAIGLSHGIVGLYETGDRTPSPDALARIIEVLGVAETELIEAVA